MMGVPKREPNTPPLDIVKVPAIGREEEALVRQEK